MYSVVLDPGHGGIGGYPREKYGDRYDPIGKKYLDNYKEGAAYGSLYENEIMYTIALKVEKILRNCSTEGNYTTFAGILKNYTDQIPDRIYIETHMSREKGISKKTAGKMTDPNSNYRLFDGPGFFTNNRKGRLSKINELKPQLVVSLHCARSGPADFEGMSPCIVPPYAFLEKGLHYLQKKITDKKVYHSSAYSYWFVESVKHDDFFWFLNDTALYFTGYPIDKNKELDLESFMGYRYNMIEWSYKDRPGWEPFAARHYPHTRFSTDMSTFSPDGKFWERERSKYENFRRDNGEEGFGGDNAYASYEIIRYILHALTIKGERYHVQKPGKSYISVWIMPLHVNAISAFIELGYLMRRGDRYLLTSRQDIIAEGIAVGIYSLFTGLKPKASKQKYPPRGNKIDLDKYRISDKKTYFDAVVNY